MIRLLVSVPAGLFLLFIRLSAAEPFIRLFAPAARFWTPAFSFIRPRAMSAPRAVATARVTSALEPVAATVALPATFAPDSSVARALELAMLTATLAPTAVLSPALNALAATVSAEASLATTFRSPATAFCSASV